MTRRAPLPATGLRAAASNPSAAAGLRVATGNPAAATSPRVAASNPAAAASPRAATGNPSAAAGPRAVASNPSAAAGLRAAASNPSAATSPRAAASNPAAATGLRAATGNPAAAAGLRVAAGNPAAATSPRVAASNPAAAAGLRVAASNPSAAAGLRVAATNPSAAAGLRAAAGNPAAAPGLRAATGNRCGLPVSASAGLRAFARGWLCALLLIPAAHAFQSPADGGFCPEGAFSATRWPEHNRPANLKTWGSFCSNGDADTGHVESQEFLAPAVLRLYLAGYLTMPGCRLTLKNVGSGNEMELRPPDSPGLLWRLSSFPVRPDWVGKPVRLIADDQATGIGGWFAFSEPVLPGFTVLAPAIATAGTPAGFCPDGIPAGTRWPSGTRPPDVVTLGSYCNSGESDTGWAASRPVAAGAYLSLYVAGGLRTPGMRIAVENTLTGEQLLLQPAESPGMSWSLLHVRMPSEWIGQNVRVAAEDKAASSWIGFSEPFSPGFAGGLWSACQILVLVLATAFLLLLPPVAACLAAALRGVKDLLDLTAIALLALGFTGYLAFWTYFLRHALGTLFCGGTLVASLAFVIWAPAAESRRSRLLPARQLIAPGGLVILASLFIMALGLLRGGMHSALDLASTRFSPPDLVGDNILPKLLADGVYSGNIPRPLMSEWLSSDRPPLQAGNSLWTYRWTPGDRGLDYLALSVILQCSFLAGLWAFLVAGNTGRKALALTVAMCFFTANTFVNGFYTWPKLYPAAYLFVAAGYLLTDRYHQVRRHAWAGAIVGIAVAFAMLCHGGSMFAVLGIAGAMLVLRRFPGYRFTVALAGAAIILYVPWMLYQKLYDPPGDRLVKFHLTGIQAPRPRESLTQLLIASYRELGIPGTIDYKLSNFKTLAGDLSLYLDNATELAGGVASGDVRARDSAAGSIRWLRFHCWIPCIGLACLGPLALLVGWYHGRRADLGTAGRLWLCIAMTIVGWCLVMFGPKTTTVHQGTSFAVIGAMAASCLAFWTIRPALAVTVAALEIFWSAVLYIWLMPPPPAAGNGPAAAALDGPVDMGFAALCLLSAAAMFAVLLAYARQAEGGDAASRLAAAAQSGASLAHDASRLPVAGSDS